MKKLLTFILPALVLTAGAPQPATGAGACSLDAAQCGSEPRYIAIVYEPGTSRTAIGDGPSANAAKQEAFDLCGANCKLGLEPGVARCVAVARAGLDDGWAWGFAIGGREAGNVALADCKRERAARLQAKQEQAEQEQAKQEQAEQAPNPYMEAMMEAMNAPDPAFTDGEAPEPIPHPTPEKGSRDKDIFQQQSEQSVRKKQAPMTDGDILGMWGLDLKKIERELEQAPEPEEAPEPIPPPQAQQPAQQPRIGGPDENIFQLNSEAFANRAEAFADLEKEWADEDEREREELYRQNSGRIYFHGGSYIEECPPGLVRDSPTGACMTRELQDAPRKAREAAQELENLRKEQQARADQGAREYADLRAKHQARADQGAREYADLRAKQRTKRDAWRAKEQAEQQTPYQIYMAAMEREIQKYPQEYRQEMRAWMEDQEWVKEMKRLGHDYATTEQERRERAGLQNRFSTQQRGGPGSCDIGDEWHEGRCQSIIKLKEEAQRRAWAGGSGGGSSQSGGSSTARRRGGYDDDGDGIK